MTNEEFAIYFNNAKTQYKGIGYVLCPAFNYEQIHFTSCGFNHISRKDVSLGHFWTLTRFVESTKVQVVIRQLNSGRKHFFSVMT